MIKHSKTTYQIRVKNTRNSIVATTATATVVKDGNDTSIAIEMHEVISHTLPMTYEKLMPGDVCVQYIDETLRYGVRNRKRTVTSLRFSGVYIPKTSNDTTSDETIIDRFLLLVDLTFA